MKPTKRVRVNPRDDVIRRDIKHGVAGIRFPVEGSVEWPLDQFTKRRLRDGSVTMETEEQKKDRENQRASEDQRSRERDRSSRPPMRAARTETPAS